MGFEIHWNDQKVHKLHSGHLSASELIRSLELMQSDPRFDRARQVVHDFSAVDSHGITEDTLGEFAALQYGAQNSNPHFRVALVCAQPQLHDLLKKVLLDKGLSTCSTAVVSTPAEAWQWLQRPSDSEHYGRWTHSSQGVQRRDV